MQGRQLEILRAIVDEYVSTEEPVGSKTLAARSGLGVSPATIRNEMASSLSYVYEKTSCPCAQKRKERCSGS